MGYLVPIQTQVETKFGEVNVTINLNLNIKLDTSGNLIVEANNKDLPKNEIFSKEVVPFEKPDLEDNQEIINFGKQV